MRIKSERQTRERDWKREVRVPGDQENKVA